MARKIFFLMPLIVLTFSFALCEEKVKWINIHVVEQKEQANVQVHLPLSIVDAAVKAIDTKEMHLGKVKLPIKETDIDFVNLFKEIKNAPDGDYVKVDSKEANVIVAKKKGMIYINVDEKEGDKAKVEIKIPDAILDAITVDENNELDISNIFSVLQNYSTGDLVTVQADGTSVRIWIE